MHGGCCVAGRESRSKGAIRQTNPLRLLAPTQSPPPLRQARAVDKARRGRFVNGADLDGEAAAGLRPAPDRGRTSLHPSDLVDAPKACSHTLRSTSGPCKPAGGVERNISRCVSLQRTTHLTHGAPRPSSATSTAFRLMRWSPSEASASQQSWGCFSVSECSRGD